MKKMFFISVVALMVCVLFSACGEPYISENELENTVSVVADFSAGADFAFKVCCI
jgi:ABC-type Zn uptake system ZnuABC Zn-binding protein ZnuA